MGDDNKTGEAKKVDDVKLPKRLEDLEEELKRIEAKKRRALEKGMPKKESIEPLDKLIDQLKYEVGKALIEDAKREIKAASDEAKAIALDKPQKEAPKVKEEVKPGADQTAIKEVEDEIERIKQKLQKAKDNGATDNDIKEFVNDNDIQDLKKAIAEAALEAARRELKEALDKLKAVKDPPKPKIDVKPSPEQDAIKAAEDEGKRIQQKIDKARENGATDGELSPLKNDLKAMKKAVREAAIAAAKRELKRLKQDLKDIRDGKAPAPPKHGDSPGQTPPPQNGGSGDGGGNKGGSGGGGGAGGTGSGGGASGGGGGSGAAGDGGGAGAGKSTVTEKSQDPLILYVKSDHTVWAWSRRDQAWISQKFSSKIIEVKIIKGGILAVAEKRAAIYDVLFGRWLQVLDSGGELLTGAEAS